MMSQTMDQSAQLVIGQEEDVIIPQNVPQSSQEGVNQLGGRTCGDLLSVLRDTPKIDGTGRKWKRLLAEHAGIRPKRRSARLPSATVVMRRGNVDGRYLLGLPLSFCESHLPECDEKVMLVSEDNREYITEFTAAKCTLGGDGWKEFAVEKELIHGDTLLIEKISPLKYKVSIRKEPPSLPKSLPAQPGIGSSTSPRISAAPKDMAVEKATSSRQLARCDDRSVETDSTFTTIVCPNNGGTNFFDFSNFKSDLCASGVFMKLEEDTVMKYYELCCSQKMYLHSNLLPDWNSAFIAATIFELVDISEAIRCSHLNTRRDMYEKWGIKLGHIQHLGMEVGFLERRLQRLSSLACNPSREAKQKRMQEARAQKENTEAIFKQMQETLKSLNKEIADLGTEEDREISTYLDEAGASW